MNITHYDLFAGIGGFSLALEEAFNEAKIKHIFCEWEQDWREVATATCNARMDDGFPREVDGISYSFAKWRNESIKAYGNAIVPQVAMEIFRAIKMTVELNYTKSCK